jgi:PTS system glucitol/sorbitol-specific IIA component
MTGEPGTAEPADADEVRYDTVVVAVGEMVEEFRGQGVMILFGEQAPEELWEFSVRHRPGTAAGGPAPGDVVEVDGVRLPVLAVGDVVEDNLLNLGHLDLKADGRTSPTLPGDVCVPAAELPAPRPGSVIRVLRPQRGVAP